MNNAESNQGLGAGEPGSDQLNQDDTLLDRGIADILDEGYSPPDNAPAARIGVTAREELAGESIDQRITQEQPEVWSDDFKPAIDETRAGRLVEAFVPDFGADGIRQDQYAEDVGIDGGAASAEEAAIHIVPETDLDYDEVSGG